MDFEGWFLIKFLIYLGSFLLPNWFGRFLHTFHTRCRPRCRSVNKIYVSVEVDMILINLTNWKHQVDQVYLTVRTDEG